MSSEQQQVDVKLRWEDGGARRDQSRDTVEVGEAGDEEALQEHLDPESDEPAEEDADDEFEWDADREQALLDALEETVEGSSPIVHRYIETVMMGLKAQTMAADEATEMLVEIQAYLDDQIEWEQSKAPVEHEDFMRSRKDKLNALYAWSESRAAIAEYVQSGDEVQLKVASYAAEQARGFLEQSLDMLMACEPEDDWEEDDFEDEEFESEEYEPEEEETGT